LPENRTQWLCGKPVTEQSLSKDAAKKAMGRLVKLDRFGRLKLHKGRASRGFESRATVIVLAERREHDRGTWKMRRVLSGELSAFWLIATVAKEQQSR